MKIKNKNGFTLIEMLIVLAIIGVISSAFIGLVNVIKGGDSLGYEKEGAYMIYQEMEDILKDLKRGKVIEKEGNLYKMTYYRIDISNNGLSIKNVYLYEDENHNEDDNSIQAIFDETVIVSGSDFKLKNKRETNNLKFNFYAKSENGEILDMVADTQYNGVLTNSAEKLRDSTMRTGGYNSTIQENFIDCQGNNIMSQMIGCGLQEANEESIVENNNFTPFYEEYFVIKSNGQNIGKIIFNVKTLTIRLEYCGTNNCNI